MEMELERGAARTIQTSTAAQSGAQASPRDAHTDCSCRARDPAAIARRHLFLMCGT